ncbi:MAG: hypothetical protein R3F56_16255 [Planctomycetota bacterium]
MQRVLLLAPLALVAVSLSAQQRPTVVVPFATGTTSVPAERHRWQGFDAAPVPRLFLPEIPEHERLPVPIGHNDLPQPPDLPSRAAAASGPGAPDTIRFWNRSTLPMPASACCPEPTATLSRDTAFVTANTWGAVSVDAGSSWTFVNPGTLFPAIDAGVCCDQRVLRDPRNDLTIWFIQYGRSSLTGRGSVRVAVAVGRDDLRDQIWFSWVFDPQMFNQPSSRWFDFPDVAVTNTFLYLTSNVFDFSGNNTNSVVWRVPLTDLAQGNRLTAQWATRQAPGSSSFLGSSGSYRFTQGAGGTMYWGGHEDTATLRIYRMPDNSNTASFDDRSIPSWVQATPMALAPNGINWVANADPRIQGGYAKPSEYGFLWTCPQQTGRPFPFVRVARFRVSDHTLFAAQDTYNNDVAVAYPAIATNVRGDRGVTMAVGGPDTHVHNVVYLVDQFDPQHHNQRWRAVIDVPDSSPSMPRWGDYFSVERNHTEPFTFVCSAADPQGGAQAQYVWFSRELDQPAFNTLSVGSVPSGVAVTLAETDLDGQKDGVTTFTRRFAQYQGYTLTAPLVHQSGSEVWTFDHWSGNGGNTTNRTVEVADMGTTSHAMSAFYDVARKLSVGSAPTDGATIILTVADVNGQRNGATPFQRVYRPPQSVTLFAPTSYNGGAFKWWRVDDGALRFVFTNDVTVQLSSLNVQVQAEFEERVSGSTRSFGSGCNGSTGQSPLHDVSGTPEVGMRVVYSCARLIPGSRVWFMLGVSDRQFAGLPLPFEMSPVGAPGCVTYCSQELVLGATAPAAGRLQLPLDFPNDVALVGASVFTQFFAQDTVANRLGLVTSNAYETTLGGVR